MKNKLRRLTVNFSVTLLILIIGIYVGLSVYYRNSFTYNTWINGVYSTGKTIEEINNELVNNFKAEAIIVSEPDNVTEYIYPEDVDFSIDFIEPLTKAKENVNSFLWVKGLIGKGNEIIIYPDFSYNGDVLSEKVNGLLFVKDHLRENNEKIRIVFSPGKGYTLIDKHINPIDTDKVINSISRAFYEKNKVILDDSFLLPKEYTIEEQKVINTWKSVEKFLETSITYDMGTEIVPVDGKALSEFLYYDGNSFETDFDGKLKINNDAVKAFIDGLADEYDTYTDTRTFHSYLKGDKEIPNVYYGTLIDRDAEYIYLYEAVLKGTRENHIPKYLKTGFVRGKNDIGLTYIEIDMESQILYYFEDGVLKLNTDIVSGLPGGNATPSMICSVYNKRSPAILVGTNYRSPVSYWMGIYKAIGLHDASWQSAFGGTRYLTHGSHGCINMKLNDVRILYDSVEVGTPVILYY